MVAIGTNRAEIPVDTIGCKPSESTVDINPTSANNPSFPTFKDGKKVST